MRWEMGMWEKEKKAGQPEPKAVFRRPTPGISSTMRNSLILLVFGGFLSVLERIKFARHSK